VRQWRGALIACAAIAAFLVLFIHVAGPHRLIAVAQPADPASARLP
jgi:hypothetical protein